MSERHQSSQRPMPDDVIYFIRRPCSCESHQTLDLISRTSRGPSVGLIVGSWLDASPDFCQKDQQGPRCLAAGCESARPTPGAWRPHPSHAPAWAVLCCHCLDVWNCQTGPVGPVWHCCCCCCVSWQHLHLLLYSADWPDPLHTHQTRSAWFSDLVMTTTSSFGRLQQGATGP